MRTSKSENAQVRPRKGVKDWSAQERYVNRSIRIRKHVQKWLRNHVGEKWLDMMSIARECANEFRPEPCSTQAAYNWISQFTASNAPYMVIADEDGYELAMRTKESIPE